MPTGVYQNHTGYTRAHPVLTNRITWINVLPPPSTRPTNHQKIWQPLVNVECMHILARHFKLEHLKHILRAPCAFYFDDLQNEVAIIQSLIGGETLRIHWLFKTFCTFRPYTLPFREEFRVEFWQWKCFLFRLCWSYKLYRTFKPHLWLF